MSTEPTSTNQTPSPQSAFPPSDQNPWITERELFRRSHMKFCRSRNSKEAEFAPTLRQMTRSFDELWYISQGGRRTFAWEHPEKWRSMCEEMEKEEEVVVVEKEDEEDMSDVRYTPPEDEEEKHDPCDNSIGPMDDMISGMGELDKEKEKAVERKDSKDVAPLQRPALQNGWWSLVRTRTQASEKNKAAAEKAAAQESAIVIPNGSGSGASANASGSGSSWGSGPVFHGAELEMIMMEEQRQCYGGKSAWSA